jgi:sugar lactone lactonase YvrE
MGERSGGRNRSRTPFKRLARREVAALSLAGLVLLLVTAGALAVTGDLTQPAGSAGCVSQTGAGPCADGHALIRASSVAVSPNGKSVYATSYDSDAVVRFNRNPTTGAIGQPASSTGCVSETGAGPCADGHGLVGAYSVAVSPDGKSVYVASYASDAVTRFTRNTTTGAIAQPAGSAGCLSETGTAGTCANGHGLNGAQSVAVSADGKSVYVSSSLSDAVARLNRNPTTGAITQPASSTGCVSETGAGTCADGHALDGAQSVAVSADGKSLYLASRLSDAVARFTRNTTTGAITQPASGTGCVSETGAGTCADGHALDGAYSVAVSADGKSVYLASFDSDAVARFTRNTTTGAIAQPASSTGCVSETGAGTCGNGHALGGPRSVAVSADGKSVYLASADFDAVARFTRNTTTGAIGQPAGSAGCVSQTGTEGTCADGHALVGANSVAVSADGKSVYVASFFSDAVARFDRAP